MWHFSNLASFNSVKELPIVLVVAMFLLTGCERSSNLPVIIINCSDVVRQVDQVCEFQYGKKMSGRTEVRIRGNSSLQYPKKSLRLETDTTISFCGLPAHHVWVLNANYIDKSFIRHRLSFDLFRAMGAHNLSPNGCYRETEVNGEYSGVYFVHERIDQERCGIMDQQPGGVIFKEPPVFLEEHAQFEPGEHPWGQKYPDENEQDMTALAVELQAFLQNSSDSSFTEQVTSWFHLENMADWMLLLMLTNNTDGAYRNFYLYRLHEGLPFRTAIWDYDETFGRFGDNRLNNIKAEVDFVNHPLFGRLLKMDSFRELLRKRWFRHRQEVLKNEAIMLRINEYVTELEPVINRNFDRWPVDGPGYVDGLGHQDEIELIREFILQRLSTLDRRMEELRIP